MEIKEFKKQLKKEINKRIIKKRQYLWRKQNYQNKKKLQKEQEERVMIIIKNIVENNISTL
jgi:hypothetical protein